MRRDELEHVIRAAAAITGDSEIGRGTGLPDELTGDVGSNRNGDADSGAGSSPRTVRLAPGTTWKSLWACGRKPRTWFGVWLSARSRNPPSPGTPPRRELPSKNQRRLPTRSKNSG
jgi:hypothetical protein